MTGARAPNQVIGLVIESGIGDVLTSMCALRWVRMAYPGRTLEIFICSESPARAAGMVNVAESHPDISAVHVVHDVGCIARQYPAHRIINFSPWQYLNRHSREVFARLDYHLPAEDHAVATEFLSAVPTPPIVLQPIASNPQVNWPVERWAELARLIEQRYPVVLVGGPGEPTISSTAIDLRGQLTVRQSLAVALRARGAILARSFLSIATMDACIPTIVMTPRTRLHELEYAYPPSYFATGRARLLDVAASPGRAMELLEQCMGPGLQDSYRLDS